MYIPKEDKAKLENAVSAQGALAVTALAEMAGGEVCHRDWYAAGYMQGYAHGIDAACHIIEHAEDI